MKTHHLLGGSLDVLQVSSVLSAKSIERRSCTINVCDIRFNNGDNLAERLSQSHHKVLAAGVYPSTMRGLAHQGRESPEKEERCGDPNKQIQPMFNAR